ncbi:MAG: type I DNA topoisomerase [Oligoflexia bacterium]|nr:type I DNA topoisomerase [Oligoflexia bacterium]
MGKSLVIVESPTKAKTIGKFLGKDFEVLASYGHVRDLPNNAAEIPAEIKKEKWSRLGVNVDKKFEPLYIIPEVKKKRVKELKAAIKGAKELLLATDEDREGESISWHLLQVLAPKIPVKRLVFHEITKEAIEHSLQSARSVDENLVRAQETRRVVDRLFGYSVSPLLWKKMAPRLSAGRVQSVAMRLLVERERERIAFHRAMYWDLKAVFSKKGSHQSEDQFEAELTHVGDKRVASGKDFDPATGRLSEKADVVLLDEKGAAKLRESLLGTGAEISSIEEKPFTQRPYAPFTTSTLQQEASRKLSFSARRTMQVAQVLYENGFITYMRTDSTTLSDEALNAARTLIKRDFGEQYLASEARLYKTKVKNAQEAHEAIRPAGKDFIAPALVKEKFGAEAFRLYELIWQRTIASQMKDAHGTRVGVQVRCGDATFRASGKTIEFPGFLRVYVEGSDDPEQELAEREKVLPKLAQGEKVDGKSFDALSHETQPPARYTEGTLIKELERRGIGRPSTWATIVDVVLSRDYAFKRGTALVPTFLATALTNLMESYFTNLVDYEFTARLEDDLDAISRGEADYLNYLKKFYFGNGHPGLKTLVEKGGETIDPRIVCGIPVGQVEGGGKIEVRIGRFGPFLTDGTNRASVPDMMAPDEMLLEKAKGILAEAAKGPASLGKHPESGQPVYLKKGRFGPYVQLGDMVEGAEVKPKMASLLPGMQPDAVTLDIALQLLSLPRTLGKHPENQQDIVAANGRFGPYVKCGVETRSIPLDQFTPINITLEQALELLKQPKRRGRATTPTNLREVGKHPTTDANLVIKSGRYGPYVTDGKINASLPRGMDPNSLSIQDAVNLLDARAAKANSEEPAPKKKKTARRGKKKAA